MLGFRSSVLSSGCISFSHFSYASMLTMRLIALNRCKQVVKPYLGKG